MTKIDGISINELTEQYGSPLFVISAQNVRNNTIAFHNEFHNRYPKTRVAYAYKANSLISVLEIVHKEGAWAEVASGYEYDIAKKMGVPGKKIVFNGPYKRREELSRAIEEGALINVDNTNELELISEIASKHEKTIDIGIRINADVGIPQFIDRFGFNLDSGEALKIVGNSLREKLLNIVGVHIHLTSYIIEPADTGDFVPAKQIKLIWPKSFNLYRNAAEKIVNFVREVKCTHGINIKYINMGGGFPDVDSLSPYADAIVDPIIVGLNEQPPILILEPGRAIIRNAVHLITTIIGIKELPNGIRGITIDAGINSLPTSVLKFQEIKPLKEVKGYLRDTIVYGPLCLQTDIIGRENLPEFELGERLIIPNVGAYNISQSSSFIFPRPSVILIEDGKPRLIKC